MEQGIAVMLIDPKDISFVQPIPIKHMDPMGLLPNTTEAAALWQFLICAFQALQHVETQTTLEGDEDQQVDLKQIAHSIRKLYLLDTLEGMFADALVACAKREAARSKLNWDTRIDAWFASGGKSYNTLDRDADKVGL
jgi:hypothetical protein